MTKRTLLCTVALVVCAWKPAESQAVVQVSALPDWKVQYDAPTTVIGVGETVVWDLAPWETPREGETHVDPNVRAALIGVERNRPVTISVTSQHGFPVVLVADGPLQASFRLAVESDSTEIDEWAPGDPIAFAMGDTTSVSLSITPRHDAVWQVWVWVRRDDLREQEPLELDDEAKAPWLEMGYTEEQIQLMLQMPRFIEAWQR